MTKSWDMIFGSVGLTGGWRTGISFEVGGTTLLSPPGDRKSIWLERSTRSPELETHVALQSSSTRHVLQSLLSQSPPLIPVLQVKGCLGKACPPLSFELLSLWRRYTHIHSFHAGSLGSGFAAEHAKMYISIFRHLKKKKCGFALKRYEIRNYS